LPSRLHDWDPTYMLRSTSKIRANPHLPSRKANNIVIGLLLYVVQRRQEVYLNVSSLRLGAPNITKIVVQL
jgi:hypothetical protein